MYTHIEDYIIELYKNLSINNPEQLEIGKIALSLGIKLHYGESTYRFGDNIIIQFTTKQRQWQLFGHEVCHYLRHYGNQLRMKDSFRDLQEWQANNFAYHFCIPTFMLDKLYIFTVTDIMNLFNVEFDFALRRLEMYQNKLIGGFENARAY
ncbi:ImmA/IrrE family metallo-endopeptidase [Paucisalibacillus globulus]|uniref:ImmA/IrrE family metallo-endopeptidase n=1 Tax=Paucisalibacillus globulus TaxID=351095 RepID=UPI0015966839|nr:ImmA/IrrE family metallo-endopeptidase [Paucisalibacillus globulus]